MKKKIQENVYKNDVDPIVINGEIYYGKSKWEGMASVDGCAKIYIYKHVHMSICYNQC